MHEEEKLGASGGKQAVGLEEGRRESVCKCQEIAGGIQGAGGRLYKLGGSTDQLGVRSSRIPE